MFFFSSPNTDVAVSQDKSVRCTRGNCRTEGHYSVLTKLTVHSFAGICSGFIHFLHWLNCKFLSLKTISCLQHIIWPVQRWQHFYVLFAKQQISSRYLITGVLQAWRWPLTSPLPQESVNPVVKQNPERIHFWSRLTESSFAFTNNHILIHIHNHTQNL